MKVKTYDQFLKEELGWKDALIGAAIGLSPFIPQQAKSQTPYTQQQNQKVLSTVSFERKEPVSNPDLDLVHGALGSKRLDDDFEKRVQDELSNQVNAGEKPDVTNIKVVTEVKGGYVITKASCDIVESQDGIAYTHFTTRGSIGNDYEIRHDKQIDGLVGRLENAYGGVSKQVGDSFEITFRVGNHSVSYKQSFFVASDGKPVAKILPHTYSIKASNTGELRMRLKNETDGLSIDVNSISIDIKTLEVKFKAGPTKITNLSLVTDNLGNIDSRLVDIKSENPTMQVIDKGVANGLQWALLLF